MVAAMTKPSQPRSTNISSSVSATSFGPPTMASCTWPRPEKSTKSRALGLLLPEAFNTPSRMPKMPCMLFSSSEVSGSSRSFEAKS